MPKLAFLDPTKTGRAAEDLENQLHHLVVGQEDAIHQIVRAYLRRIFDIELEMVRRRIQIAAASKPSLVNVTDSAREFCWWRAPISDTGAAVETRYKALARITVVEPDDQPPDF